MVKHLPSRLEALVQILSPTSKNAYKKVKTLTSNVHSQRINLQATFSFSGNSNSSGREEKSFTCEIKVLLFYSVSQSSDCRNCAMVLC